MKKLFSLLSIFIIGLLLSSSPALAAGSSSCPVNQDYNMVEEYISNIRSLTSNITKEATSSKNTPKDNEKLLDKLSIDGDVFRQMWNDVGSWTGYKLYAQYYLTFSLANEIPGEIRADHDKLQREIENLEKYLKQLAKTGHADAQVENICGDMANCNLSGTAFDVTVTMIKETSLLLELLRATIMGEDDASYTNIMFTNNNFTTYKKALGTKYGPSAIEACSNSGDGFMAQIKAAISQITWHNQSAKDGIKDWEDALALINGDPKNKAYQDQERKLLSDELSRQGVGGSQKQQIMKNLEDYNTKGGFSKDNNFLSNSFKNIGSSLSKQWSHFITTISEMMPKDESTTSLGELKSSSIADIAGQDSQNQITQNIRKEIERVYQTEMQFAGVEDLSTKQVEGKIIELHNNLLQSIKILEKTKALAEKFCKSTDGSAGNCDTN